MLCRKGPPQSRLSYDMRQQLALFDRIGKKIGVETGFTEDQFQRGVAETEDLDFVLWLSRMYPTPRIPLRSLGDVV